MADAYQSWQQKTRPCSYWIVGGEAMASAKTITVTVISSNEGLAKFLEHFDKYHYVYATNQLYIDIVNFVVYNWENKITVDQFIAGLHARIDRIAALKIYSKMKRYLLLRKTALDAQDPSIIAGA